MPKFGIPGAHTRTPPSMPGILSSGTELSLSDVVLCGTTAWC